MCPDYKKIYTDLISEKFPLKLNECQDFFNKKTLNSLDIIQLNNVLFPNNKFNDQKHKSYDKQSIFEMLKYQREEKLNNSQLALHFKLSRNTVAAWKKKYKI
ncbi:helix-turn-helix domain-containing protein [Chryseobacterium vaccae]|uniref:helix-turn-helix domain-containing protein n=1 Tax=Chryseobacterium vaccae TaxID=2604424 RepID=UPI001295571E|nr:helix-turn-helix domain-containing protein [Chryseobacterium vaccae]